MFIYYLLILISVMLFGSGFYINDLYRIKRGSSLKVSMESACIGALAGLVVLFVCGGFSLKVTIFTFLMALWSAVNGIAFTFCAFKALENINLSLFSLFAMLGGMLLPFLQGVAFFQEQITLAKVICVVLVCVSLCCTIKKDGEKKGVIFYIGIFILNGMAGVITKFFTASTLPKASAFDYSSWIAIITIVLSGVAWLVLNSAKKSQSQVNNISKKTLVQSYFLGASYGIINRVGNLLLVFALVYVDSSVQYPMVTGGTIIVSTLISCFGSNKPSKRELFGVIIAFLAMCVLFFIPF